MTTTAVTLPERDYERLFEDHPFPLYIFDAETFRFLAVNKAALEQYGYTREEFLTLTALDIRPPDEFPFFERLHDEVPASFSPMGLTRHQRRDGKVFHVQTYARKTEFHGRRAKMVMIINIDERVRAEDALRSIINNTKDIIWSMDRDQNIIAANNAFWERVALITGKEPTDIRPEDYDPSLFNVWHAYIARALAGENYKIIYESEDLGYRSYAEISFNPVFGQTGEVVGVTCFSRDITEHQNRLAQIELQNQRFREIAWLQSHKLRNHVANIMGLVECMQEEGPGDPELLRLLKDAAQYMDTVIREICKQTDTN